MLLLEGHKSAVYALAFSPDGRWTASGDKGGSVLLWDAGYLPTRLRGAAVSDLVTVNAVSFDPTGDRIAIATSRGFTIASSSGEFPFQHTLRMERGVINGTSEESTIDGVTGVRFLSNNLVSLGYGNRMKPEAGRLEIWDAVNVTWRQPNFIAPHGVRSVDVHRPSNRVAWSEWERRLFVWDSLKSDPVRFNLTDNAVSIAFHPDGELLAASQQWGVRLFDLARRQEKAHLKGHKGQVSSVAFSPDGRTLATGSWDGTVRFWDPSSGRETACYQWPTGKVFALAFAPDGLRLAAAGEKGSIVMWDLD